MKIRLGVIVVLILGLVKGWSADQIQMQNGDRYMGKVVSITTDTVVLQNDVLGKVSLPRSKVASISIGSALATPITPSTNPTQAITPTTPISNSDLNAALYRLGGNTNFIDDIKKQFLAGAGPAANAKFDELVGGMMGGKFDLNHLRSQAKAAADQIRAIKHSGVDVGDTMDTYLAILDKFLKESASTNASAAAVARPSTNTVGTITIVK